MILLVLKSMSIKVAYIQKGNITLNRMLSQQLQNEDLAVNFCLDFKRFREIAQESDGVGDNYLGFSREPEPATRGVECRKEFVLRYHGGFGKVIEKRRLAGIGVPHNRDHRGHSTIPESPSQRSLLAQLGNLILQGSDTTADAAAVYFEFGLTGTSPADSTG